MKDKLIKKKKIICMLLLLFAFFLGFIPLQSVVAEDAGNNPIGVQIEEIDYDQAFMRINPNGNTKVYYAASGKTAWNEVEGEKDGDCLILDISWISNKTNYKMDLKGSEDGIIVTVTLPAANNKLKVTYNQVEEKLIFQNNNDAEFFEWKKSTFYDEWNTEVPINLEGTKGEEFKKTMEALKTKGGKIIVRLPQVTGTSKEDVGERASNQAIISIPKRANAPSLKVNVNTLICNTTTAMEYQIYSVGGALQNSTTWISCTKGMSLSELTPQAFALTSAGADVVVAVRKAATTKAGYSKTSYFTIPAQEIAPTEIVETITADSFSISFSQASKENAYQYVVIPAGATINEAKLSWKTVTSSKAVKFMSKSYQTGTKIYVRIKGISQTKKVSLRLPSAYTTITISYSE